MTDCMNYAYDIRIYYNALNSSFVLIKLLMKFPERAAFVYISTFFKLARI